MADSSRPSQKQCALRIGLWKLKKSLSFIVCPAYYTWVFTWLIVSSLCSSIDIDATDTSRIILYDSYNDTKVETMEGITIINDWWLTDKYVSSWSNCRCNYY